ncbi:MAG: MFS transporter [Acetobacteraceae bacterium]|nr:MFS transporter [Acetobacteraceae bacterium]
MNLWRVIRDHPAFRTVWLTQSVSQLGDYMYVVTVAWLVAELTGSKAALAAVRTAGMLPVVVLGLAAGVWVDGSDRRRTLMACDAFRMALAGAFALLIWLQAVTFASLVCIAALFGAARAFFDPAYMAYVPQLLDRDDLVTANGLEYVGQRLLSVAGPGLGGLLVEAAGCALNVGLNALSFGIGVLGLWLSRPRLACNPPGRPSPAEFVRDLGSAFTYLRTRRDLCVCSCWGAPAICAKRPS